MLIYVEILPLNKHHHPHLPLLPDMTIHHHPLLHLLPVMIIHHHLLLPLLQPPCQWLPTSWPYSLMLTDGVVRREVTVATLAQHAAKITDETQTQQKLCHFSFHLHSVCSVEVFTLLWLRHN